MSIPATAVLGADLSAREIEVIEQASRGLTEPEAARETFHSVKTVKFHRTNARRKLGARSTAHAVAIAMRAGLID